MADGRLERAGLDWMALAGLVALVATMAALITGGWIAVFP